MDFAVALMILLCTATICVIMLVCAGAICSELADLTEAIKAVVKDSKDSNA